MKNGRFASEPGEEGERGKGKGERGKGRIFDDLPISRSPDLPISRSPDLPISRFPDLPDPRQILDE